MRWYSVACSEHVEARLLWQGACLSIQMQRGRELLFSYF